MRVARLSFLIGILFLISAQPARPGGQTATQGVSAPQLLQQSLAALQGNTPIMDVTLSGTARRIAGSDDESGPATLKALANGSARMDLTLSGGLRSEVANLTGTTVAGSWSGPDGVSHGMAFHNLLTEPCWFFPAFVIARRLTTSGFLATYIGQETRNGQAVQHVSVSQAASVPNPPNGFSIEHLTHVDIFLDATTLLPAAITFNTHPDNNALLDLPVEIEFSNYTSIQGAQVPFHIQKFLNNSLLLDFQVQTITPNSGLPTSLFNVQ